MEILKDNIENFKKEAAEFFGGNGVENFKYQVATNFMNYKTENVEYRPNDFLHTFLNLIEENPYTQLTEVFFDYYDRTILEHIKSQVNANWYFTSSDAGSVKIGSEDFNILIPNGYGDGTTEVIVTHGAAHVPLRFYTTVQGNFYIYDHDCGDTVETELNGSYSIYTQDQTVVFEKISE